MRILWKVSNFHQIRNCLTIYCHVLAGGVAAYDDFEDGGADEYINEEGPESESDDDMAVEEEESKPIKQTKTKKHGRSDISAIRNTAAASGTPTVTVVIGGNKRKNTDKYVPSCFHTELNSGCDLLCDSKSRTCPSGDEEEVQGL
jgi:methylmalonyl-CoA mutase cobalamin-binding subunit